MSYASSDRPHSPPLPVFGALRARLEAMQIAFRTYRRQRAVYLRTLQELQSYRPHELLDLGIQSGDIEELARQQAGW